MLKCSIFIEQLNSYRFFFVLVRFFLQKCVCMIIKLKGIIPPLCILKCRDYNPSLLCLLICKNSIAGTMLVQFVFVDSFPLYFVIMLEPY